MSMMTVHLFFYIVVCLSSWVQASDAHIEATLKDVSEDGITVKIAQLLLQNPDCILRIDCGQENKSIKSELKLPPFGQPFVPIHHVVFYGKVSGIADLFLVDSIRITSIELNLTGVQWVGRGFLHNCLNIRSIELKALKDIITIEQYFLSQCRMLEYADLTELREVTTINDGFFSNATALKSWT